jgi:hypothetical protein
VLARRTLTAGGEALVLRLPVARLGRARGVLMLAVASDGVRVTRAVRLR